jgi:hypothetical protein
MSITVDDHGHILKPTDRPGHGLSLLCLKCGLHYKDGDERKACDPKDGVAIKLFLDDERRCPIGYALHTKTAEEAITWLQTRTVWHVSLDHDLDSEHYEYGVRQDQPGYGMPPEPWPRDTFKVKTGYAVLEWMRDNDAWVPDIQVHSLSSGANDMMAFIRKYAPRWVESRRVRIKA